jgi:VanZ family protein
MRSELIDQVARVWSGLVGFAIVLLSVVPPQLRPVTAAHGFGHFATFLLLGLTVGLGYPGRYRPSTIALLIFTAVVELLQLIAPGRHARLSDFLVDALGAMVGLCLAGILRIVLDRKARAS